MCVVPRGAHRQPVPGEDTAVVLIETRATVNTGDTPSDLTASRHLVYRRFCSV